MKKERIIQMLFLFVLAATFMLPMGCSNPVEEMSDLGSVENAGNSSEAVGLDAVSRRRASLYKRTIVVTFYYMYDPRIEDDWSSAGGSSTMKIKDGGTWKTFTVQNKFFKRYAMEGSGWFYPNHPNGPFNSSDEVWTINLRGDTAADGFDIVAKSKVWGYGANDNDLDPLRSVAVNNSTSDNYPITMGHRVVIPALSGIPLKVPRLGRGGRGRYAVPRSGNFRADDESWSFDIWNYNQKGYGWVDVFCGDYKTFKKYERYLEAEADKNGGNGTIYARYRTLTGISPGPEAGNTESWLVTKAYCGSGLRVTCLDGLAGKKARKVKKNDYVTYRKKLYRAKKNLAKRKIKIKLPRGGYFFKWISIPKPRNGQSNSNYEYINLKM